MIGVWYHGKGGGGYGRKKRWKHPRLGYGPDPLGSDGARCVEFFPCSFCCLKGTLPETNIAHDVSLQEGNWKTSKRTILGQLGWDACCLQNCHGASKI